MGRRSAIVRESDFYRTTIMDLVAHGGPDQRRKAADKLTVGRADREAANESDPDRRAGLPSHLAARAGAADGESYAGTLRKRPACAPPVGSLRHDPHAGGMGTGTAASVWTRLSTPTMAADKSAPDDR